MILGPGGLLRTDKAKALRSEAGLNATHLIEPTSKLQ